MLEKAFTKIPDNTNLILHSDQGWQYQHKHYQKMLKEKGIRQSMSRKGNCLDNACAENFFGLLKTELLYLQEFHSVEHFIEELHEYIEWYNNKRIKLKLNGLSPVEFRHKAALQKRPRFLLVALHKFSFESLSNFLGSVHSLSGAFVLDDLSRFRVQNDGISC